MIGALQSRPAVEPTLLAPPDGLMGGRRPAGGGGVCGALHPGRNQVCLGVGGNGRRKQCHRPVDLPTSSHYPARPPATASQSASQTGMHSAG